jgi:hypothetical protein
MPVKVILASNIILREPSKERLKHPDINTNPILAVPHSKGISCVFDVDQLNESLETDMEHESLPSHRKSVK